MILLIIILASILFGMCCTIIVEHVINSTMSTEMQAILQQFHERLDTANSALDTFEMRNEIDLFCKILIKLSSEVIYKCQLCRCTEFTKTDYPGIIVTVNVLNGLQERTSKSMQGLIVTYRHILLDWLEFNNRVRTDNGNNRS